MQVAVITRARGDSIVIRSRRGLLTFSLVLLCAAFATNESRADAPAGLRTGPAAWVEEYWDVKPERLDEFVKVYKRDVYSLARQIPGYRGYTFLTNTPDPADPSRPNLFGEKMFLNHYGVHLEGETITKKVINVGNLLRRTHNVVIVHSLQTWKDAAAFRSNLESRHAAAHQGQKYAEYLSRTLYPLANNYWEERFHLIKTGLPIEPGTGSGGKDADGLSLEPHPSGNNWFKEYFQVDANQLQAFLKGYDETYAVMRGIPGYRGVTIVTTLPPEGAEAARTGYKNEELGGSSQLYVPQPGVAMDGEVRTDTSINFGSFFKNTYTIITYYETPPGSKLLEIMQKNWEALGNKGDRIERVTKVLFPHALNHWDMQYRAIETSLVPLP